LNHHFFAHSQICSFQQFPVSLYQEKNRTMRRRRELGISKIVTPAFWPTVLLTPPSLKSE